MSEVSEDSHFGSMSGVSEDDFRRCRRALENAASKAQGAEEQEWLEALSAALPIVEKYECPNKSEIRRIAKLLGVPQFESGKNIQSSTLFQDIKRTFVSCVLERRCVLEHPAIRGLLQDVIELGRIPREIKNPQSQAGRIPRHKGT